MTAKIDPTLLFNFLESSIASFRALDGNMEPGTTGNERVAGAILALTQVHAEAAAGSFNES